MDVSVAQLAATSRALARARSLEEIWDAVGSWLTASGLHGAIGEFCGDEVRPVSVSLPDNRQARFEELTGMSMTTLRLPVSGFSSFRTVRDQRVGMREPRFPGRLLGMVPNLSAAERLEAARLVGEGPLCAMPIQAGDRLLGVLMAWSVKDDTTEQLVETMASQAGLAWAGLLGRAGADLEVRPQVPAPELTGQVRDLLEHGGLRIALQPVVRLTDGTVMGYEALARFSPRPGFRTPGELFEAALETAVQQEVYRACLNEGLAAGRHVLPATLFVNVPASLLVSTPHPGRELEAMARSHGVDPAGVVLEVSERTPIEDLHRLLRVVADLRGHGFRIAIDDAGAGSAGMLMVAEVRPEFIKIDRQLVGGIDTSTARRALAVSLLSFGAHINARVIAEGVETEQELQTLLSIGLQFGQGWYLGRPAVVGSAEDLRDVIEVGPRWFAERPSEPFLTAVPVPAPERRLRDRRAGESEAGNLAGALVEATTALQSEHHPRRILEEIATQLQRVVPVDDLSIYAADQASHRFVPVYADGDEAGETMAFSFDMDQGMTGWAFASGAPQYVANSGTHPAAITIPGTPVEEPESLLLVPLIAGDRGLGMLNARRLGVDRFTAADLVAASLFANVAAVAWRNAELYAELSERATTDSLTGLLNSRWLRDTGEREMAQSRRAGRPLSLLLIDLDHFKQINDSGGHGAGDMVLRRVASELRGMVRAGDAAVRLGGEEFLLVLRDADEDAALRVAEKLRARLRMLTLPRACRPRERVSASIGVAAFPRDAHTLDELIRRADAAMYHAKQNGRDLVVAASQLDSLAADLTAVGAGVVPGPE